MKVVIIIIDLYRILMPPLSLHKEQNLQTEILIGHKKVEILMVQCKETNTAVEYN